MFLEVFLRRTGLGQSGTIQTAEVGMFIDQKLRSDARPDDEWVGAYLRLPTTTTAQAEIVPVMGSDPSRGAIFHQPLANEDPLVYEGRKYELWRWVHPEDALRELDVILEQEVFLPALIPCSELSEPASWDLDVTGSATAEVRYAPAEQEPIPYRRYVAISGSGELVRGGISALPNCSLYCAALVRKTGPGAAYVELRNADMSAVLSRAEPVGQAWQFLELPGPVALSYPAELELGIGVDGIELLLADVVFLDLNARSVALPPWVRSPLQVREVHMLRGWKVSGNTLEPVLSGPHDGRFDVERSAWGSMRAQLVSKAGPIAEPLFIRAYRPETAWADDHREVKVLPLEYLVAKLAVRLFEHLMEMPVNLYDQQQWAASRLQYWRDQLKLLEIRLSDERAERGRSGYQMGLFRARKPWRSLGWRM
jgi:hypothetical protein